MQVKEGNILKSPSRQTLFTWLQFINPYQKTYSHKQMKPLNLRASQYKVYNVGPKLTFFPGCDEHKRK